MPLCLKPEASPFTYGTFQLPSELRKSENNPSPYIGAKNRPCHHLRKQSLWLLELFQKPRILLLGVRTPWFFAQTFCLFFVMKQITLCVKDFEKISNHIPEFASLISWRESKTKKQMQKGCANALIFTIVQTLYNALHSFFKGQKFKKQNQRQKSKSNRQSILEEDDTTSREPRAAKPVAALPQTGSVAVHTRNIPEADGVAKERTEKEVVVTVF